MTVENVFAIDVCGQYVKANVPYRKDDTGNIFPVGTYSKKMDQVLETPQISDICIIEHVNNANILFDQFHKENTCMEKER